MNPQKNIEIALSDHELSELATILEKATPKEPKKRLSVILVVNNAIILFIFINVQCAVMI